MTFLKKLFAWLFAEKGYHFGLLLLRLAGGGFMMTHGWAKIQKFAALSETFADPIGLGPKWSLILIIFAEFGCSILLVLGAFTRLAAIPLMIGMVVAAFFAHPGFEFSKSELSLLFLTVYTAFLFMGAGRYSVDHLLGRKLFAIKP